MGALDSFFANSVEFCFYLGIGGSVIFLVMLVMLMTGLGGDDFDSGDFDPANVDMGGDGALSLVSFFSIRSLVAFLTFFGWAGYFWGGTLGGFIIAVICGLVMMTLTTLTVYFFIKMQQSGNIEPPEFIGKTGTVYLSIPADGIGTVTAILNGCTRQIRATAAEALPQGAQVKIVAVVSPDCFKVEKI